MESLEFLPFCRFMLSLALLLAAPPSFAHEVLRPRNFMELGGDLTVERAHRVEGATVAWADYGAIRRDFPALHAFSNEQIDAWLVENFAFIGSEQARLNDIRNTPIPTSFGTKPAFRPVDWNRSAVLEAYAPDGSVIGMVDVKGIGHGARTRAEVKEQVTAFRRFMESEDHDGLEKLRVKHHSDGLMSLGEAAAEVDRQKAVQRLFELSGYGLETVESYATLRLPFNIRKDQGQEIAAALQLRQAQIGRDMGLVVPSSIYVDHRGGRQMTASGTAVDFGAVMIQDPRLKANFGPLPDAADPLDAQTSKPWAWGHKTAQSYDQGDRLALHRHLGEMLSPLPEAPTEAVRARQAVLEKKVATLRQQGVPIAQIAQSLLQERYSPQLLADALADPDLGVRVDAARALRSATGPEFLPLIEKALRSPDSDVRAQAVLALEARRDPESLPLIEKELRNPGTRLSALRALQGRNDPSSRALIERFVYAPEGPDAPKTQTRIEVLRTLVGRDDVPALPWLERALHDAEASVRSEAIKVLRGRRDPESLNLLKRSLRHPTAAVREAAASALQGRKDPGALRWIEKALGDAEPRVRAAAASALQNRDDAASLALLRKALRDPSLEVRSAATTGLAGRSDPGSLPLIQDALREPEVGIRMRAALALQGRTHRKALSLFRKALEDPHPGVRLNAVWALRGNARAENVQALVRILQEPSPPELRKAALLALKEMLEADASLVPLVPSLSREAEAILGVARLRHERLRKAEPSSACARKFKEL